MGRSGWFQKKCDTCRHLQDKIIELEYDLKRAKLDNDKWNLEKILERMHMQILGKKNVQMEIDEKRLNYFKDLVDILYKYIDIKEKM